MLRCGISYLHYMMKCFCLEGGWGEEETEIAARNSHPALSQAVKEEELDRLLGIVVDVENLFMCVHKEEDSDTKQVFPPLKNIFGTKMLALSKFTY